MNRGIYYSFDYKCIIIAGQNTNDRLFIKFQNSDMNNIRIIYLLFVSLFVFCSCGKSDKTPPVTEITLPTLSILDVSQVRDNKLTTNYRFFINVSSSSLKSITANYTTLEGTAIANKDFTSVSGTLTIPPNTTVGYIDVPVKGDSLRQADQLFYIQLSAPVNATILGAGKATATIQNQGTYLPGDGTGYTTPLTYPGYHLAWSDEFNGATLDNTNWNYETGGGGWGNNELENYTTSSNNSFLSNGNLVIEARKETLGTNSYTSARLTTKKSFTYGRIDIRAKLPKGKGIWPALWMLGSNISTLPWPACGEIDIMELLGHEPQKTYGTMHWGPAGGASTHIGSNYSLTSEDFSQKFHVFSLIWDVDKLTWYIDDIKFFTGNKTAVTGNYPFDKPFFFIFNVAVGGSWPGNPDATTVFPQRMIVDYIRVFQ